MLKHTMCLAAVLCGTFTAGESSGLALGPNSTVPFCPHAHAWRFRERNWRYAKMVNPEPSSRNAAG